MVMLSLIVLCFVGMQRAYESADLGLDTNHALLWNGAQAVAQQEAITWVLAHVPASSLVVIDQCMCTELHDPSTGQAAFNGAHYYWKVEEDSAIRDAVFHDSWRHIDYIVMTVQMLTDARMSDMTLVETAPAHSVAVARFETGGWPIEVRKVVKAGRPTSPPPTADVRALHLNPVYVTSEATLDTFAPPIVVSG